MSKDSNHWASFSAFARDRLVLGPSLVCPVRVAWREYLAYCDEWGFDGAEAHEFVRWMGAEEGVEIHGPSGRGRLRRYFSGIGVI